MTGGTGGAGDLIGLESRVTAHILGEGDGVLLSEESSSPDAMRRWGADRTVCAGAIRAAFLHRARDDSSQCVYLRGLVIDGPLDLNCLSSEANVRLVDCYLPSGLMLRNARLSSLDLTGCLIEDGDGPSLSLDNLCLRFDLRLEHLNVVSRTSLTAVSLHGAEITGCVFAAGISVDNRDGPAMDGTNLEVNGDIHLDRATMIGGHLSEAALTLRGAMAGGRLHLSNATIKGRHGPALDADRLRVTTGLRAKRLEACGASEHAGVVSFVDAHIGGRTDFSLARITSTEGPAFLASRIKVDGDLNLVDTTMTGRGGRSAANLFSAQVAGTFLMTGAVLTNTEGSVLDGQRLVVNGDADLSRAVLRCDSPGSAALNLFSAHVGGYMSLAAARIKNTLGTAVFAVKLQVTGDLRLNEQFRASGAGGDGAVRLHAAKIEGVLNLTTARISSHQGPAISARAMDLGADLRADGVTLQCQSVGTGTQPRPMVDLRGTKVRGRLEVQLEAIRRHLETGSAGERKLVALDNLEFGVLDERNSADDWIWLLAEATPDYSSQPYQHLANRYRAQGEERDARQLLMAQHQDQLRRSGPQRRPQRIWQQLAGVMLGFGHQPWRAVFGLLAVFAVMSVLALWGGGLTGSGCHAVQRIGRAVETSLPLIRMAQLEGCSTGSGAGGLVFTLVAWIAQVASYMFATLFIVGLTTAVRRRPS